MIFYIGTNIKFLFIYIKGIVFKEKMEYKMSGKMPMEGSDA